VSDSSAAAVCAPLNEHPGAAALFLDLDGTLAPIVADPRDAHMIDGAREAIVRLRARLGLVGFVSGRAIDDLRRIADVPGCAYAGNHGFELQAPGGPTVIAAEARSWLPAIAEYAAYWEPALLEAAGLYIEPKGATLSVHWRRAPDRDAAREVLETRFAPEAESRGLAVTWGRMVMEVRPPVRVDKGTAVVELLAAGPWRHAVYIGDDRTDADAWRALQGLRDAGALTSAAGVIATAPDTPEDLRAAADAAVCGPDGVLELLTSLADALPGPR
jgi:trehalose 6-phosphate phosphatase